MDSLIPCNGRIFGQMATIFDRDGRETATMRHADILEESSWQMK